MANRRFQLNEKQVRELLSAFERCKDGPLRTRLQAVRLYGSGYDTQQVQEITGTTHRTLMRWCSRYRRGGIEALAEQRRGGNRAALTADQVALVKDNLHRYRPVDVLGAEQVATAAGLHWTVPDLRHALLQWTGVHYRTASSYRELFARCGFSYQRTQKRFRSRSVAKVAEFEEQIEKN